MTSELMDRATTADITALQAINLIQELRTDLALLNYQAHLETEMQKKMNVILKSRVETLEAEVKTLREQNERFEAREKSYGEVIAHVEQELERFEAKLKSKSKFQQKIGKDSRVKNLTKALSMENLSI